MTITDEMVEKAQEGRGLPAMNDKLMYDVMGKALKAFYNDPTTVSEDLRRAIEAVAPLLIAQGMREAVRLSGEGWTIEYILAQATVKELQ